MQDAKSLQRMTVLGGLEVGVERLGVMVDGAIDMGLESPQPDI